MQLDLLVRCLAWLVAEFAFDNRCILDVCDGFWVTSGRTAFDTGRARGWAGGMFGSHSSRLESWCRVLGWSFDLNLEIIQENMVGMLSEGSTLVVGVLNGR